MSSPRASLIPEPLLEFGDGRTASDPRVGLTVFGPADVGTPTRPAVLTYGVVGTEAGIQAFARWRKLLDSPLQPKKGSNPHLWPPFPPFEATFETHFPLKPLWTGLLSRAEIDALSNRADPYLRAHGLANAYLAAIRAALRRDEVSKVIVCVVPDIIWERCRPGRGRVHLAPVPPEVQMKRAGQLSMFQPVETEPYEYSVDFRRQLKARVMELGVPVQIIRESTLAQEDNPRRSLTPVPDRAWNLSTALYYKAGGRPWKLSAVRPGVCYLGIAFRRSSTSEGDRTACCAAQMFLDSGDGMVFLGDFGPWYSPKRKEFHLTREAASALLRQALTTYQDLQGRPLTEIFIHSRSGISFDEYQGYKDACPPGASVIGVRVRRERYGLRMFRSGDYPVLRGTQLAFTDRNAFLWTSGLKPQLGTYDGLGVPLPLRIDVQHGPGNIDQVCRDVLALSKLNYNTCRFSDSDPVTVGFSDAIGEILVSNPTTSVRRQNFRFYI